MGSRAGISVAALVVTTLALSGSSSAAVTCNFVASSSGSDSAPGTAAAPFATPQKLVDSLGPGQTGCLRAGTYLQDVTVRHGGTAAAPIVLRSYQGESATLQGRLRIAAGADYTSVSHLSLVGLENGHDCSKMCASPTIDANHTSFVRDDVTNDHADTICFLLGDSGGVWGTANYTTIEYDRIHGCGALPATNYDHGIYVEETYGSQIVDNLIYNNADRGIQLYPHAVDTVIRGNVIDGNGEGVDFGATAQYAADDNVVENNIISNSNVLYNVLSAYNASTLVPAGNVVRNNCIGGGALDNAGNPGGIRFDHTGFELSGNVLAIPQFQDRTRGDFTLTANSPCQGILTSGTSTSTPPTQGTARHKRARAHAARLRTVVRVRHVRRVRMHGLRMVRVSGVVRRVTASGQQRFARCKAFRRVVVRLFRHRKWATVAGGHTRGNCTFSAVGRFRTRKRSALEALVYGVGRSRTFFVRRGAR